MLCYEPSVVLTHGVVALYFSTDWCGPCKRFKPAAEDVFNELGVDVYFVDAEDEWELARNHKVRGVPTIILYVDGDVVLEHSGEVPAAALKAMLEKHLPGPYEYRQD